VLLIGNVAWTAHDYFVVWPSLDVVRFWHQAGLKGVADQLQRDPDTSPVAVCVPDQLIAEGDRWWEPAWRLMRFLLNRPDLALRYYNCVDTLVLIDGAARYAFPDAADANALQKFPIYQQYLAASDSDQLQLPDRLGMIVRADRSAMPLARQLDQITASSTITLDNGLSAHAPIDLDGKVEFLGYTLSAESIKRGNAFDLATYWRVKATLPARLTQFTHVLNSKGEIATQLDRLMLTSASLLPSDVFVEMQHITVPGNLKAGEYSLSIGLYTQTDNTRLPIIQDGQPRGDRLFLKPIAITK
jgi:hypothetical protein